MHILRLIAPLPLLLAAAPVPPLAPGQWEETLVFALDSVNGSPEAAAHMGASLPNPQPQRACYTDTDLADPQRIFLAGAEQACHFEHFAMNGGRIDAAGTCSDGHGMAMRVTGSGSYTAAGYDFAFTGTGQAGNLALAFRGRDSGRRIGPCPSGGA